MPAPPPPPDQFDVAATLRSAGCVFAEDEARLLIEAAQTPADLAAMVDRRVSGVPLEQLLGWVEFAGLRIAIDPGVFVPRRRTEFLAQHAIDIALARSAAPPTVVVELCCGSGAVAAAVIARVDQIELYAADIDAAAVRCARGNIGARGTVFEGDLYAPLPASLLGRVDVLIANAPYVPTDAIATMPPEARLYEPHVALDGGVDGLDVLRRVITAAPVWLAPGGSVLVETSERQAPAMLQTASDAGLIARVATSDELSATVVIARLRIE